jgi:hypothetical protein
MNLKGHDDELIVFLCVSIFDRFLSVKKRSVTQEEIQLVGMTALFIASKYFEVEPFGLDELISDFAFDKYTDKDFLDMETCIIKDISCEVEAPSVLEFLILYFKLIRLFLQTNGLVSADCGKYI